jgi:4'-phosphopantetheinyl transferase
MLNTTHFQDTKYSLGPLTSNCIHLWRIGISTTTDCPTPHKYYELLASDEKKRLNQIKSTKRRHEYLLSRVTLRSVLASYLDSQNPSAIQIDIETSGKPKLRDNSMGLYFNLSHTKGMILIGISHNRTIGVDIETIDGQRDIEGIAKNFFHKNELTNVPTDETQKLKYFYKLWTLKEALAKANSRGLGIPRNLLFFDISNNDGIKFLSFSENLEHDWVFYHTFCTTKPNAGYDRVYSLAVALEKRPIDIPLVVKSVYFNACTDSLKVD